MCFVKRLIAFISIVYGGQFFPIEARGPSSIRLNAHALTIGANRAPKPLSPEENLVEYAPGAVAGFRLFIAKNFHR